MKPILLKGHERSITKLKYNREGDLIFTTSKDAKTCVWYSDTGERLGTYNGHQGAIRSLDVSFDSSQLITGGADNSVMLWDIPTGQGLATFPRKSIVQSVAWATGDRMFLSVTDAVMKAVPSIQIQVLTDPLDRLKVDKEIVINDTKKITHALWESTNKNIVCSLQDGTMRVYDVETSQIVLEKKPHTKGINHFEFSKDYGSIITASEDTTAKLLDARTLETLKTFETEKPVNAAAISPDPKTPYILLGGGQSAENVTTTSSRVGSFQVRVYHKIYQEELASVRGHFGPVNTLAFAPDGKGFASGGEDGYIRLHKFDQAFYDLAKDIEKPKLPKDD